MRIRIKEEDFTPIADPKEPKPEAKQFQILASMITNTKVNELIFFILIFKLLSIKVSSFFIGRIYQS